LSSRVQMFRDFMNITFWCRIADLDCCWLTYSSTRGATFTSQSERACETHMAIGMPVLSE
jgi:hypothetical protein